MDRDRHSSALWGRYLEVLGVLRDVAVAHDEAGELAALLAELRGDDR